MVWRICTDNLHYEKFADGTVKCIEDEIPFEVPKGWEWCRLSNIVQFINGDRGKNYPSKSDYLPNGIPWINTGHILDEGILTEKEMLFISQEKYDSLHSGKIAENDLVLCLRGATFGKVARVKPYKIGAIASSLVIIRCYEYSLAEYLYYYLRSDLAIQQLHLYDNGSAQPNLAAGDVQKYLFPLPPIKEALMISERISILLALVSKISQEKRNLNAIIANIKTKILDLAIRGQLVPQNPDDEPASVLLERIRIEKEELIKQGKIKRDKKESITFKGEDNSYYETVAGNTVCLDNELPFQLPEGWVWSRLQNISSVLTDGTHKTPIYSNDGYVFLSSKNVTTGKIDWDNVMYISEELHEELYKRLAPMPGDILLAKNGTTGVAALVDKNIVFDIYVSLALIRITKKIIEPQYILYIIGSSYIQEYFNKSLKGIGVPNLHLEHIRKTLIPIPPYAEQIRIIECTSKISDMIEKISEALL